MGDSAANLINCSSAGLGIMTSVTVANEDPRDPHKSPNPEGKSYSRSDVVLVELEEHLNVHKLYYSSAEINITEQVKDSDTSRKLIGVEYTDLFGRFPRNEMFVEDQARNFQEVQPPLETHELSEIYDSSVKRQLGLKQTEVTELGHVTAEKAKEIGLYRKVRENSSISLKGIGPLRSPGTKIGYSLGSRNMLSGSGILAGYLMIILTILQSFPHPASGISLAPVSWNSSNPIFKSSRNDHIIDVKLYDDIDFICPYYPPGGQHHIRHQSHHEEQYVVYMVSKVEYDDCNVYSETSALMVLNCSNPRQRKRFTILFEPFQSIPNVPEYRANGTYYFMTTSTGKPEGIGNLYQGACRKHNMKLTIKICCSPNSGADRALDKRVTKPPSVSKDFEVDKSFTGNNQKSASILDWEKDRNRVLADQPASTTPRLTDEENRFGITPRGSSVENEFDKRIFSSKSDDTIKPSKRDSMLESSHLSQQQQRQQLSSAAHSIFIFSLSSYSIPASLLLYFNLLTILVSQKIAIHALCTDHIIN